MATTGERPRIACLVFGGTAGPDFIEAARRFADLVVGSEATLDVPPGNGVVVAEPPRGGARLGPLLTAATAAGARWALWLRSDERIPPDALPALERLVEVDGVPGVVYGLANGGSHRFRLHAIGDRPPRLGGGPDPVGFEVTRRVPTQIPLVDAAGPGHGETVSEAFAAPVVEDLGDLDLDAPSLSVVLDDRRPITALRSARAIASADVELLVAGAGRRARLLARLCHGRPLPVSRRAGWMEVRTAAPRVARGDYLAFVDADVLVTAAWRDATLAAHGEGFAAVRAGPTYSYACEAYTRTITGATADEDVARRIGNLMRTTDIGDAEARPAGRWWRGRMLTILVAGLDEALDSGTGRADVLLLVAVDLLRADVRVLSVPRGLPVFIPGVGPGRINEAYHHGAANQRGPAGGAALLAEVVTAGVGVPVDRTIVVDFEGFRRIVDLLGGIEVEVESEVPYLSRASGRWEPRSIEPGPQSLDGDLALTYVRSRMADSDDARRRRQLAVVVGAVRRLRSVRSPRRALDIVSAARASLQTTLRGRDFALLAQAALRVRPRAVSVSRIGHPVVRSMRRASDGLWVTAGEPAAIRAFARRALRLPVTPEMESGGDGSQDLPPEARERDEAPSRRPLRSIMWRGMSGNNVIDLHGMLACLGFYSGAIDDDEFDEETEQAVEAFQAAHGLEIDGIAGMPTWTALDAAIDAEARRPEVQMARLAEYAKARAVPYPGFGGCYGAMAKYIRAVGYGRIGPGSWPVPMTHWTAPRQFAEYLEDDDHLRELGLKRLPITRPHDAPVGALLVIKAGSPGTRHPTYGDMSVAVGDGKFCNDGTQTYGEPDRFKADGGELLGAWVPAGDD